ncbi:MAG: AEC family transporter [Eubacteriales bacterium]|nr:AEC family transporter [Eubacteriales bacterium]
MLINFIISVHAVLPLFCLMSIGYFIRKSGIISENVLPDLNKLVFHIFLPLLLFSNIYGTEIQGIVRGKLIFFTLSAIFIVFLGAVVFAMLVEKNNGSRGSIIQSIYRSNLVLMGMPLAASIYGDHNVGVTAVMVSIIVPIYNVLAVITLEVFRSTEVQFGRVLSGILKNPLIIGGAAGILAALLEIRLPAVLEEIITDTAGAAMPLALIVLGASIKFSSIERCRRNLIIGVVGRLVAVPALCLSTGVLLGFRGIEFVTLVAIFASPVAVSSFTMATQMNSDADLAANNVAFTSAFACFTMFLWIFLFKHLGMF